MNVHLAAAAAALVLALVPAHAAARDGAQPVKLSDAQLDEVVGGDHGHGPPAFVLAGLAGQRGREMRGEHGGGPAPTQIGTQVNFIIRDVTLTFNIGDNSPTNLAAVLQLSLLSTAAQTGSASALQAVH
jgi:hypothetical protein